jgi:hypothetical protein
MSAITGQSSSDRIDQLQDELDRCLEIAESPHGEDENSYFWAIDRAQKIRAELKALEPLPCTAPRFVSAIRSGRNADGFSRDSGKLVHAVPLRDDETRLYDGSGRTALCGAKPSGRAYWVVSMLAKVTCAKCLRKMGGPAP